MRGGQMAVTILDQMQVFDQEIAPARPVGQQRAHFIQRLGVDLTALGRTRRPALARPRRRLHVLACNAHFVLPTREKPF